MNGISAYNRSEQKWYVGVFIVLNCYKNGQFSVCGNDPFVDTKLFINKLEV